MTISASIPLRNARLQAIVTTQDAGANPAYINIYDGTRPPITGGNITTQVILGTCVFSSPSGTVNNALLTLNPITDDVSADADGVASWCRVFDGDDTFLYDMDCGTSGSGAEVIFNTTTIVTGGAISIISASFIEGNA